MKIARVFPRRTSATPTDALAMVLDRLEHFQKGPYACRETALAITKLEECLMWLRKRTISREQRGVLGTSNI